MNFDKLRVFVVYTEEVRQYVFEEHVLDYNQIQQLVKQHRFSKNEDFHFA